MPLLLVKQFAFDLEFLAVANALGFRRIREQPVTLDYRFTGSGVRSPAVLLALVDTAAIFYRLRILRYYQRKRSLLPEVRSRRRALASRLARRGSARCSTIRTRRPGSRISAPEARLDAARTPRARSSPSSSDGATPARNWLESTVPFLANPEIAAVVTASMTPARGSVRERAAAALAESFLGGGSLYFRFTPGNLRFVRHFPAENVVVRKDDLLALDARSGSSEPALRRPHRARAQGLYTPETVVVVPRPPLFRPHLRQAFAYGRRPERRSSAAWPARAPA